MKKIILTAALSLSAFLWASVASAETCVRIDIKPCSCPNAISTNCNGNVPNAEIAVAILGDCCTDVTTICSVHFAVNGNINTGPQAPVKECSIEDVNGDGILDLVCHFSRCDLGIDCSTTMGTITGEFCGGGTLVGIDSIRPVPCNN